MASLWRCLHGPQLSRIFRGPETEGRQYSPNAVEYISHGIIRSLGMIWNVSLYTSPLIVPILYKKDYLTRNRIFYLLKFSLVFGILFIGSYLIRGLGRYTNRDYTTFLLALNNAKSNFCYETKKQLARYDFSFWAWPVEFRMSQIEGEFKKPVKTNVSSSRRSTMFERISALPCQVISYVIAHTIGRRLLYPGSLQLLQSAMSPLLLQGRVRLIEEYDGERFKLLTRDENHIDVMFVDRRGNHSYANGSFLVICCEGNAGFYETGIMDTPIQANYSVIGWNHPGFGGSTGEPFPEQELNAIDAVLQFAIHHLGFPLHSIILYAWSIGGYTATWAASTYPEIHGLILDATFDDLLPLAVAQMPRSWKPLVVRTVREYLNLNVAEQLLQFNGAVLLIRRSNDEVITIGDSSNIQANRGNFLLTKLLQMRYPNIFTSQVQDLLKQWLASNRNEQMSLLRQNNVDDAFCQTLVTTCAEEEHGIYPSSLGEDMALETKLQLGLFLASKYMMDFDAGHCQPLPSDMFILPWHPIPS